MSKAIWVILVMAAIIVLWVLLQPKLIKEEIKPTAPVRQPGTNPTPTFPLPVTAGGANDYLKKTNQGNLKDLLDRYRKATNIDQKREIALQLQQFVPETREDMELIKGILFAKEWNEELFQICTVLLKNIKDPKLAKDLIEILEKEKKYWNSPEKVDSVVKQ